MTIEEIRKRKIELGYSNQYLAELSGVPIGTLQKIMAGKTQAPRRETILALEKVLGRNQEIQGVREAVPAYGKQGGYTLEDYLALPEDQRVELIDGVFYDMAAPTTIHQAIGGFIHKQLLDYVLEHGGPCMPFMSPVDVQLDEDDRTVVQPDVLIVCERNRYRYGRVFGAPDFVAEVLSRSTRKKDMRLKLAKYMDAGVREYWMIDPEKKSLVVYDLEHDEFPVIYGADAKVPVRIWNGECKVDMGLIFRHIDFLYESMGEWDF